jgi:carboxylesterase type B
LRDGREQAKSAGPVEGLQAAVGAELVVQVPHVRPDRVHRHVELAGDLRSGKAGRQEAQDTGLGLAERLGQLPRPGLRRDRDWYGRRPPAQRADDLTEQRRVRGALPDMTAPQQPEAADEAASRYLAIVGIGSDEGAAEALRQVPAADLLSAYGRLAAQFPQPGSAAPPMWPVLGGASVPLRWQDGLAGAPVRQILIGRTEDEMTAFPAAAAAHPGGIAAATEELFGAGVTQIAEACSAPGALVYRFARGSAADPALGATHCSDLPFAFDNLDAYSGAPMLGPVSDSDRTLGRSLSTALARFAATGVAGDPEWPAYQPGEHPHIRRFGG